jgi:hypothetical protein
MHLRIHHLGDLVTDRSPQNDVRFIRRELEIAFQPSSQFGCGLRNSPEEPAIPDVIRYSSFSNRGPRVPTDQIHRNSTSTKSPARLFLSSVALDRMSVADKEQRAPLIDRKVHRGAFRKSVIVHVAALRSEPARAKRLTGGRRYADIPHWLHQTRNPFSCSVGLPAWPRPLPGRAANRHRTSSNSRRDSSWAVWRPAQCDHRCPPNPD